MTKRFGNFPVQETNNKKPKTNDDLWGDDFDAKDIEDCFLLASQLKEKEEQRSICTQRNNVSIIPPYNVFQTSSKRMFTSTQSDPELNSSIHGPSTSKAPATNGFYKKPQIVNENGFKRNHSFDGSDFSISQLEKKVKELEEQCLRREGEVSILRTQLRQLKINNEHELKKKENSWSETFLTTKKRLDSVESQLHFKDLEIANLKQKVKEVAKINSFDTTLNSTQTLSFKRKKNNTLSSNSTNTSGTLKKVYLESFTIQPIVEMTQPIQELIPSSLFKLSKEERLIKNPTILHENDKQYTLDDCYAEICHLMTCNKQEINSETNHTAINKVIYVSEQLIKNLYEFLQESKDNTQENRKTNRIGLDNKLQIPTVQSIFSHKEWCENEMGINARISIACISALLPHNTYLRQYLLFNQKLIFRQDDFVHNLPSVWSKLDDNYSNKFDYLNLISSVVSLIGTLQKSNVFCGFLCAVTVLVNNISMCTNVDDKILSIVSGILREIILSSQNIQIVLHLTEVLSNASMHNFYVKELCTMPKQDDQRQIFQYNNGTCVVGVLCVLFEEHVLKSETSENVQLYLNFVKFLSNIVKCNPKWLFYEDDKHCKCLCKIVKIFIEVMYRAIKKLHQNCVNLTEKPTYYDVLLHGLSVLFNLNFKKYDLRFEYMITKTQYKKLILYILLHKVSLNLDETQVKLLELNIPENIPTRNRIFNSLYLWH